MTGLEFFGGGGGVALDAAQTWTAKQTWVGAAAGTDEIATRVTGDSVDRFVLNADGKMEWGPGNGAADCALYRFGVNQLRTDDVFQVNTNATTGDLNAGSVYSGNFVVAANWMRFDGTGGGGFLEGTEQSSDAAAPDANKGRLYFKDSGGGKTQLVVRFNSGAVQVIATEP